MKNKITLLTAAVVLAMLAGLSPRASAQTYDRQHASTIVFAGSGTDPVHTLSFVAPALSGTPTITLPGQSLVFPATNVLGILWNDASGNLSWLTTLTGLTINNSTIGGTSSINTSGAITSAGIVTETNASNSFGGTFTGIFNGTVGAGTPSTGAFTTLSSTGNTNIDNTGTGQTINIGNSGSTTTISGAVTYTSTPTIPLTTNDLFVGVLGDAAPLASAINAVLVTNGTANGVPSWQTTLPSGLTIPSPTITSPSISNPSFSGTVTFSTPPTLPLTLNNIYVGNSSNNAAPVTPTANAVLITAGTGNVVPQWATTLPSGLTIPSPTINSPTINNPSFTGSLTLVAGSVTNADLANSTTAIGSTGSTLTFTGGNGSGAIALGGTAGNFELNLTHANTWTATQTHNNTTGNSAPLVANNTFVNLVAGNALGATITSTGAGAGTNTALTVTASNGATNDAIEVTSGLVKIDPFTVAGVVTNNSSGVLSSVTTLPSGLTIPSPTINSPTINNPSFTGSLTLVAGSVTNADLANSTTAIGSTGSTLTFTGGNGSGAIALGGTAGNFEINLTHANTWSGTQTFGAHVLTSSSPTILGAGPTIDWALSNSSSYFKVTASTAAVVDGIAGGVDGRVIILVNTGSNNITFNTDASAETTGANKIHLAGGTSGNGFSLILAPDGFVTFIYDSSYNSVGAWRVQSSK